MTTMEALEESVMATLVQGHRVASGLGGDERFPGGTLAMQRSFFVAAGVDLEGYPLATLNLSIHPARFEVIEAKSCLPDVKWHPEAPAETFSFFDAAVRVPGEEWLPGLVYFPHPETKPEHLQPPEVLEILASDWIAGLAYGDELELALDPRQLRIIRAAP